MAWAFLLSSLRPLNGAFFIFGNVVIKNPQSLFLKTSPGGDSKRRKAYRWGENNGGNGSSNQLITQAFLSINKSSLISSEEARSQIQYLVLRLC